jgi:hypothetical protein
MDPLYSKYLEPFKAGDLTGMDGQQLEAMRLEQMRAAMPPGAGQMSVSDLSGANAPGLGQIPTSNMSGMGGNELENLRILQFLQNGQNPAGNK